MYGQNIQTPNFSNAIGQTPAERWRFSTLNDMMMSIDLAGIDYNDSITDTMEGQQALRILTDVLYEVESQGWEFNTKNNIELTLDVDGKYTFDYAGGHPYVFSLVGQDKNIYVAMDGTIKLNDDSIIDNTVLGDPDTKFTVGNVIIEAWADMHFALTQYVAALAVNRYQMLMIGSSAIVRYTEQDISTKYAAARRDEIRSGKYNILNSNFGTEVNR